MPHEWHPWFITLHKNKTSDIVTDNSFQNNQGQWWRHQMETFTVNSPHKGQWRGSLMFSLICVWINGWINNREAGDLRRYRAHFDVIVMINDNSIGTCGATRFTRHVWQFRMLKISTRFKNTVKCPNFSIQIPRILFWGRYLRFTRVMYSLICQDLVHT